MLELGLAGKIAIVTVAFLVSERASYITGTAINFDAARPRSSGETSVTMTVNRQIVLAARPAGMPTHPSLVVVHAAGPPRCGAGAAL
jgi:hypothetical protein